MSKWEGVGKVALVVGVALFISLSSIYSHSRPSILEGISTLVAFFGILVLIGMVIVAATDRGDPKAPEVTQSGHVDASSVCGAGKDARESESPPRAVPAGDSPKSDWHEQLIVGVGVTLALAGLLMLMRWGIIKGPVLLSPFIAAFVSANLIYSPSMRLGSDERLLAYFGLACVIGWAMNRWLGQVYSPSPYLLGLGVEAVLCSMAYGERLRRQTGSVSQK